MNPTDPLPPKIEAIERFRDKGIGTEASLSEIFSNLPLATRIELFPESRVVMLDVRFGELRHTCDEQEWDQVKQHLARVGVSTRRARWWEFHLR